MRKPGLFWLCILAVWSAACTPTAQEATPTPIGAERTATARPDADAIVGTSTPTPKPTAAQAKPTESKPKYGGVVRIVFRTDESRIDIHIATGARELRKASTLALQRPLAIPAGPGARDCVFYPLRPNLAKEWGWTSDTEFRLKLREGVLFHPKPPVNGRELMADDVAYSYQRYFREQDRATYGDTKVKALDRYTVAFSTPGPRTGFDALLFGQDNYGNNVFAPEAVGPKLGDMKSRTQWIGTGPFMFEGDVPGVKWVFKKHPSYFKNGLPYLDGVEFVVVPDMSTRVAAVLSGKLDIADTFTSLEVAAMKRVRPDADYRSCDNQSIDTVYIRSDLPPFADARVRRAISMAIDRQALNKTVMGGEATVIAYMSPTLAGGMEIADYPPEFRRYFEYNPAEARRLLSEAGYANGLTTDLRYSTKFGRTHNQVMESTAGFLDKIGFKVTVVPEAQAKWAATTQQGDYPGLSGGSFNMATAPMVVTSLLPGGDPQMKHPEDAKLNALGKEYLQTTNETKSAQLFKAIQMQLADKIYFLLAPVGREYAVAQPYVKDWKYKPQYKELDILLEQVWFDK